MSVAISTLALGKDRVEISVSSDGKFVATYDDEDYESTTLDELKEKLTKAHKGAQEQKAVPCSIVGLVPVEKKKNRYYSSREPFERGDGVVQCVLRGKHERHYNQWLFTSADGKRFSHDSNGVMRHLSNEEIGEWMRLTTAVNEAKAALATWEEEREAKPAELLK